MLTSERKRELEALAIKVRMGITQAVGKAVAPAGHVGGAMSAAEALAVLYGEVMDYDVTKPTGEGNDTFIISKGHAAPALYAILSEMGFFPKDWLNTMNYGGTRLPSHADRTKVPGVDATAGSLGQGMSQGVGIALANRLQGHDNYSYVMIGDGELQEGQNWEAAMYAASQKLDHFVVLLDCNKKQLDGTTDEVCSIGDPVAKFEAFGFYTQRVDGHNVEDIYDALENARVKRGVPSAIVLDTVKGKDALDIEALDYNHVALITPPIYEKLMNYYSKKLEELW